MTGDSTIGTSTAVSAKEAQPRRRAPLWVALLLGVAWLAALLALTLTTSNPVTLNGRQLARSNTVVVAEVLDSTTGRCRLEQTLRGTPPANEFLVDGLADTSAAPGNHYLMPLTTRDGRIQVTPSDFPRGARIIYPVSDDVLQQAAALSPNLNDWRIPLPKPPEPRD